MTELIDLRKVKWLALCDQAEAAANQRVPGRAVDDLAVAAGRLTTVKPVPYAAADEALLTSFRWDCTAFGLALPLTRVLLAPGLLAKAAMIRHLLTPPDPTDGAVQMAVPVIEVLDLAPEPAWLKRADIGG